MSPVQNKNLPVPAMNYQKLRIKLRQACGPFHSEQEFHKVANLIASVLIRHGVSEDDVEFESDE